MNARQACLQSCPEQAQALHTRRSGRRCRPSHPQLRVLASKRGRKAETAKPPKPQQSVQLSEGAQPPKPQQSPVPSVQPPQAAAGSPGEVPEEVNRRMLTRILAFSGIPVAIALCLFPLFYYLKVVQKVDLPMGLVYTVQSLFFGIGLVGISYGVLSASWDPKQKGSALGLDEAKQNLPVLFDELRKK